MPPPDRWDAYQPLGRVIPGTKFIAFKVPLKNEICRNLPEEESFSPEQLLQSIEASGRRLGLVVDLTFTRKYYDGQFFTRRDVQYEKIFTKGHEVPDNEVVHRFSEVVDGFSSANKDEDVLIGVHCTHGVNRTGYLVCRYMIERLNMNPEEAISLFAEARGHPIERENYISDLKTRPLAASEDHMSLQMDHNSIASMRGQHPDFRHGAGGWPTRQGHHPPQHRTWHDHNGPGHRHGFHTMGHPPGHPYNRHVAIGDRSQATHTGYQGQEWGRRHPFSGPSSLGQPDARLSGYRDGGHGRDPSYRGHSSPLDRMETPVQHGWGNAARSGWGSSMAGSGGYGNGAQHRDWNSRGPRSSYHNQPQNYSWRRSDGSHPGSVSDRGTSYRDRPRHEREGDGGRHKGESRADRDRDWRRSNATGQDGGVEHQAGKRRVDRGEHGGRRPGGEMGDQGHRNGHPGNSSNS